MTGKIICLIIITISILTLLFLYAKNMKKNLKDAAKVLAMSGLLGFVICMTEESEQSLTKDGRLLRNKAGEEWGSRESPPHKRLLWHSADETFRFPTYSGA